MVKIRIKSWEELEKIAKRQDEDGNLQMDGNTFAKNMSYLCNTTHMVDLSKSKIYIEDWNITPNMYEVVEPSLIEMICEEIGVEVGEKWLGNDGFSYTVKDNGNIIVEGVTFESLLKGKLKPVWQPKIGEKYYVPKINNREKFRFKSFEWEGFTSRIDKFYFDNNIVFKTKEEAIKCADKMISSIKESQK